MDLLLARRLNAFSPLYDSGLYDKLAKLGRDYITAGVSVLDYYLPDFDIANDLLQCFAPATKKEFEKRDRSDPESFIHPMAATELWTLATFVSQILFGGETTRKVEPRNPDDEPKADTINELLAWNDNQQPTYPQGFHWCLDSIVQNRGIMYDRWKHMYEVTLEPVSYELPWEAPIDAETGKKAKDPETGKPFKKPRGYEGEKVTRFRKKRSPVGGFVKIDLISPWDFICDPTMPLMRFQDGRFAGHRVVIPWKELKRRSELPVDDYEYVLPKVVEKLKNAHGKKATSLASGAATNMSRTHWERTKRQQPVTSVTGTDKINKEDGGVIECFCIQIRERPKNYDIFEDNEEELIEILLAGETDMLSVNVMTNKHDEFPYSVGEARPGAHQQFTPSWAMIIKGPQDYVDYMKNRHKESLARTSGNIFVGCSKYIDFEAFTDPKKDGLFIPVTEEGEGKPLDQIIKQIPIEDTTAHFYEEMSYWQRTAEETTGAHANIQGAKGEGDPTATEYVGTSQMAQGRISTVARLLSANGLVPQTNRIVSNLQQFLPNAMTIRITGSNEFNPDKPQEKFLTVIKDANQLEDGTGMDDEGNPIPRDPLLDKVASKEMHDIQGNFDVVPHDGSLPGTDARKVAALSRAIEAWATNPLLSEAFDRTHPGAIDPIKTFQKLLKATGFPSAGLIVSREDAQKNLQERMLSAGAGVGMPPAQGAQPAPVLPTAPPVGTPAGPIPSAAALPPTPPAAPPQPRPENALTA